MPNPRPGPVAFAGLKQSDFHIYEDNRLQDIRLFNAEDVPASVGLVIDNSGSMRDKRADVAKAALGCAEASNSGDEMFVVSFSERVYLGLPSSIRFTNDPEQSRSALLRNAPGRPDSAVRRPGVGIQHLKAGPRDRKALVVISLR